MNNSKGKEMSGFAKTTDKDSNADIRHRINSPFASQMEKHAAKTEQQRRETNEKKMRALSGPDSAINKEPALPSELRKESYSNKRINVILETVRNLMEVGLPTEEVPEIDNDPRYNPTIEKEDGTVVRRQEKKVSNPYWQKFSGQDPDAGEGSRNAYPVRGDQNRESFRKISQLPPISEPAPRMKPQQPTGFFPQYLPK